MRNCLFVLPALLALTGSAFADEAGANRAIGAKPAYEGRGADESGAAPVRNDSRHSIENANPNRADFPPSRESKGP